MRSNGGVEAAMHNQVGNLNCIRCVQVKDV